MPSIARVEARLRAVLDRIPHPALVAAILIGLVELFRVAIATLWRDEYQSWLYASDAPDIPAMLASLNYDGHPPLFYLFLFPLAHLGLPPASGKLLVVVFGALSLWLLFRERRLPLWGRIAIALSIVWGETLVVRSYLLLPVLLLGGVAIRGDGGSGRRRLLGYAFLGLAACTHAIGMVAGGVLALRWLLTGRLRDPRATVARELPGAIVAGLLALFSILVTRPAPDAQSTFIGLSGYTVDNGFRLLGGFARPALWVLPWWLVALGCLLVPLLALTGTRRLAWLLAAVATFGVSIYAGTGETRMLTGLLLLWAILLAEEPDAAGPARAQRWSRGAFAALLAVVGIASFPVLALQPSSLVGEASATIRPELPADAYYVGTPDFTATGFSAELGVRFWTPECDCLVGPIRGTFARNEAAKRPDEMQEKALAKVAEVLATGRPVVLMFPPDAPAPPGGRLLVRTSGSRHADEDTAIYLFEPPQP